jgi:hypothetical protein
MPFQTKRSPIVFFGGAIVATLLPVIAVAFQQNKAGN